MWREKERLEIPGLIMFFIKLLKCWPIPFCFLFEQSDEIFFYMMEGGQDAFILVMP